MTYLHTALIAVLMASGVAGAIALLLAVGLLVAEVMSRRGWQRVGDRAFGVLCYLALAGSVCAGVWIGGAVL